MDQPSMWDRWQVVSLVPAEGWHALFGTNPKVDSIPLIGWALIEELPPPSVLGGYEFPPNHRPKRKVVGLVAWGPKDGIVQVAEEIEIFSHYIHQSKIDEWHHPDAV